MLIFVVIFNLLLSLLNFYIAWRIWKLWRLLVKVTAILNRVERRMQRIFEPAPEIMLRGRKKTSYLKQRYQKLEIQLQQIQQILLLASFGLRLWQRRSKPQLSSQQHPFTLAPSP